MAGGDRLFGGSLPPPGYPVPAYDGADGVRARVEAPYRPLPAAAVESAVRLLALRPDDVFVDFGCGDGRLVAAATGRCRLAVGVELDPMLVVAARRRLRGSRGAWRILHEPLGWTPMCGATCGVLHLLPVADAFFLREIAPSAAAWVSTAHCRAALPGRPGCRGRGGGDARPGGTAVGVEVVEPAAVRLPRPWKGVTDDGQALSRRFAACRVWPVRSGDARVGCARPRTRALRTACASAPGFRLACETAWSGWPKSAASPAVRPWKKYWTAGFVASLLSSLPEPGAGPTWCTSGSTMTVTRR